MKMAISLAMTHRHQRCVSAPISFSSSWGMSPERVSISGVCLLDIMRDGRSPSLDEDAADVCGFSRL